MQVPPLAHGMHLIVPDHAKGEVGSPRGRHNLLLVVVVVVVVVIVVSGLR